MSFSFLLPFAVSTAGLFMLIKLKGFFILHPVRCAGVFLSELRSPDSRRSLCLALAGTLGVGNIFGVSAGIILGGAGSVFWLFVSSLFSMVLKYSETVLATRTGRGRHGGMHYVLSELYTKRGKFLGGIYALFCLVLALFMGAAMQSAAASEAMKASFELFPGGFALILSLLVALSVFKGGDGIEKITAILIPVASCVYIFISLGVVIHNFERLSSVLRLILSEAFSPLALGGGAVAFLSSRAVTEGFARGILSNEAGVGTSSMAHSRANERDASVAGLFGICEVFFDTVVLCLLTALVILTSVENISDFQSPMALVCAAFEATFGTAAVYILTACTAVFAFSTVICWYYYGNECCIYLFNKNRSPVYIFAFIFSIFIGALTDSFFIISVTDTALLVMAIITLFAVLRSSSVISKITEKLYK